MFPSALSMYSSHTYSTNNKNSIFRLSINARIFRRLRYFHCCKFLLSLLVYDHIYIPKDEEDDLNLRGRRKKWITVGLVVEEGARNGLQSGQRWRKPTDYYLVRGGDRRMNWITVGYKLSCRATLWMDVWLCSCLIQRKELVRKFA